MTRIVLGIDIGGTFTDVIAADTISGDLWVTKTPSTPDNQANGFFIGVENILKLSSHQGCEVVAVFHGSTVATNAILEGKGAKTGMLVTNGFRYVLEIGRHDIPRQENLYSWIKPTRPVPPRLIAEVSERVLLGGKVERPLDQDVCRLAAKRLKALDVESVAIVFLHAYANPKHERQAAEIFQELFDSSQISISSEILPVYREYERAMATVLNAYVQPLVTRYVGSLETGLRARGINASLLVMKSNGGVFGPQVAMRQPINMALSGPAAGAMGAAFITSCSGFQNAIIIDIGGTSADISLIRDGALRTTHDGEINGFPLALPMIDIHTIGAGGGSIARTLIGGGLAVGPESAGANPGPACYGKGGDLPTVTDANLVLGRLPAELLDGGMTIDPERAARSIHKHIAQPLGISITQAAQAIIRLVDNNMIGALKVVSVEKGYDPRDFALLAFGGAGPLHAVALARELGAQSVIIPPNPGLLCALGLLTSDLTYDYAKTCIQRAPQYDEKTIEVIFCELQQQAQEDLNREGIDAARQKFQRFADLRYRKQGFELTIELPSTAFDTQVASEMTQAFHELHEQLYTFANRDTPVELVTLRLRATGEMQKLVPREIEHIALGTQPQPNGLRQVWFDAPDSLETPIYARTDLKAGHRFEGPALIQQLDTTTLIFPGDLVKVDPFGNLIVTIASLS